MRPVRALALVALVSACAGGLPQQDALAAGPRDAALAAYDAAPAGERTDLVVGVARSRLARALAEGDASTRRALFARLTRSGEGARALLEALASEDDADLASRALLALAMRGDDGARKRLARLAGDADEAVAERARIARAMRADREAALEHLRATGPEERIAALRAIRREDADDLASVLLDVARRDPEPTVRASACRALPALAASDRGALRDVVDAASAASVVTACTKRLLEDASATERAAFVESLPSDLDERAIARAQAAITVIDADDGATFDELVAYVLRGLDAARPSIRAAAAALLGALREREDVSARLRLALEHDTEPVVRLAVAAALRDAPDARASVREALRALVGVEGHLGVEAVALSVEIEGFTPESQARAERALGAASANERARAYRVFVAAGDHRRALEGLFDADAAVRNGTAIAVLDAAR